jgi:hypothetical protein
MEKQLKSLIEKLKAKQVERLAVISSGSQYEVRRARAEKIVTARLLAELEAIAG